MAMAFGVLEAELKALQARLDDELRTRDRQIEELQRQLDCVINDRDWLARRPPMPKVPFPKVLRDLGYRPADAKSSDVSRK